MTPRHAAVGLASLGRRGDSTLVHMAPKEVEALNRLGAPYGRQVTRNPDTGLPEAFSFVDLLPTAAGLIGGAVFGPIGAALASGITAGAKTAAQGGDPLEIGKSALISGGGSFAGSGMLDSAAQAAGAAATNAATSTGADVASNVATNLANPAIDTGASLGEAARSQILGEPVVGFGAQSPTDNSFLGNLNTRLDQAGAKLSSIASNPEAALGGAWNYIKENPMKTALLGANVLGMGNYTPPQSPKPEEKAQLRPGFGEPWTQTYTQDPASGNYSFTYAPPVVPGPLNAAKGGRIRGMADGGSTSLNRVSLDPLESLSRNINAPQNWGISQPSSNPGFSGMMQRLYDVANQQPTSNMQMNAPGVPGVPGVGGSSTPQAAMNIGGGNTMEASGSGEGADTGEADANSSYGGGTDVFASGGAIRRYYDGGQITDMGQTQNPLMSLSNNIMQQPASSTSTSPTNQSMISGMSAPQQNQPSGFSATSPGFSGAPQDAPGLSLAGPQNFARGGVASLDGDHSMGTTQNIVNEAKAAILGEHPRPQEALDRFSDTFGPGALTILKNNLGGGRIKGAGGALDDLIPGTIEGKQQVRLADGEFVVPGDVVSGLGDGSTDQGVRKLHEMMRRVRQDRTGKISQPKRVNDRKVMPA